MMKQLLFIVAIFCSVSLLAQGDDSYVYGDRGSSSGSSSSDWGFFDPFDFQRLTIGGGLGLQVGTITLIEISPTIGYYMTRNVLFGVGGNYTYYSQRNFNTSWYGGRVFAEYFFQDFPLFAHVESELMNVAGDNERVNILNLYVGGGFRQQLGGNSFAYLLGLWNLNESPESFVTQPNPVIRAGVAIGF